MPTSNERKMLSSNEALKELTYYMSNKVNSLTDIIEWLASATLNGSRGNFPKYTNY